MATRKSASKGSGGLKKAIMGPTAQKLPTAVPASMKKMMGLKKAKKKS